MATPPPRTLAVPSELPSPERHELSAVAAQWAQHLESQPGLKNGKVSLAMMEFRRWCEKNDIRGVSFTSVMAQLNEEEGTSGLASSPRCDADGISVGVSSCDPSSPAAAVASRPIAASSPRKGAPLPRGVNGAISLSRREGAETPELQARLEALEELTVRQRDSIREQGDRIQALEHELRAQVAAGEAQDDRALASQTRLEALELLAKESQMQSCVAALRVEQDSLLAELQESWQQERSVLVDSVESRLRKCEAALARLQLTAEPVPDGSAAPAECFHRDEQEEDELDPAQVRLLECQLAAERHVHAETRAWEQDRLYAVEEELAESARRVRKLEARNRKLGKAAGVEGREKGKKVEKQAEVGSEAVTAAVATERP